MAEQQPILIMCSTPRGITATTTRRELSCGGGRRGAQRLAASQRRRRSCSKTRPGRSGVLNASRHHSDDDEILARALVDPDSRAQRLAASQRRRQSGTARRCARVSRAQRLAASQRRRLATGHAVVVVLHVLNASRHHSDDDVVWSRTGAPSWGAQRLAASQRRRQGRRRARRACAGGAQRLAASQRRRLQVTAHPPQRAPRCSTPRGITATTTPAPTQTTRARIPSAQRLAASQRRRHVHDPRGALVTFACSTPRGITATTTRGRGRVRGRGRHVLNASRHHSDDDFGPHARLFVHFRVLNASRHHSDDDWGVRSRGLASSRGAQRLAASQRRRHGEVRPNWSRYACSTPRGITATTTTNNARSRTAPPMCSTPRGITATTTRRRARTGPRWSSGAQRLAASQRRRPQSRVPRR